MIHSRDEMKFLWKLLVFPISFSFYLPSLLAPSAFPPQLTEEYRDGDTLNASSHEDI